MWIVMMKILVPPMIVMKQLDAIMFLTNAPKKMLVLLCTVVKLKDVSTKPLIVTITMFAPMTLVIQMLTLEMNVYILLSFVMMIMHVPLMLAILMLAVFTSIMLYVLPLMPATMLLAILNKDVYK
jgi:hypothetical protein